MKRLVLSLLVLSGLACGGAEKARIPVDSPLQTWQPPEEAEQEPAPTLPASPDAGPSNAGAPK